MSRTPIDRIAMASELLAYGVAAAVVGHMGWPWYLTLSTYLAAGAVIIAVSRVVHARLIADR